jgi:hypothetical protein
MPGLRLQAEFYEGAPIGIDLPPSMELTVVQTESAMKGATVSNVNKSAKLENSATVTVPLSLMKVTVFVWIQPRAAGIERAKRVTGNGKQH